MPSHHIRMRMTVSALATDEAKYVFVTHTAF